MWLSLVIKPASLLSYGSLITNLIDVNSAQGEEQIGLPRHPAPETGD